MSRTYIELLNSLGTKSQGANIRKAEKTLNNRHYSPQQRLKERIIEQLAVILLLKRSKGPIICLVGPPGVGKTSIARSIAHATNRVCEDVWGGVRDGRRLGVIDPMLAQLLVRVISLHRS